MASGIQCSLTKARRAGLQAAGSAGDRKAGWAVSCPDLQGCPSQGSSRDEAIRNVTEAIRLWLEAEAEENGIRSVETTEIAL